LAVAQLSFYSKEIKFQHDNLKVGKGLKFVLTCLGSMDDTGGQNYTPIWTVVEGIRPDIVNVSDTGRTVFFIAPQTETEIKVKLEIRDNQNDKDISEDNIIIKVV
jgi:hypothetical protein